MLYWTKTKARISAALLISAFINLTPWSALLAQTANSTPSNVASPSYTVVACNDGDTCRLKAADNMQVKVRLIGIDAPESGKKKGKKKKDGQAGSEDAKNYLNSLVVGKSVTLRSYGTDMYGRNLAEIIVNNESANLKMIKEGWAEVYRGKTPTQFNVSIYQSAESEAKKNKKGIWALPNYESPKDWRKKQRD